MIGLKLSGHAVSMIAAAAEKLFKTAAEQQTLSITEKCGTQDAILVSRLLGIDATKRHTGLVRGYIDLTKAYDKQREGRLLWL